MSGLAFPPKTPDQVAASLERAARARKGRAEVRNRLKRGSMSLSQVLKEGQTDDIIGKIRVSALLESMPGIGKVRARQIMERLGISASRRVRGLGANQRRALEAEFEPTARTNVPQKTGYAQFSKKGYTHVPKKDYSHVPKKGYTSVPKKKHVISDAISVVVYLDTNSDAVIERVVQDLDELVDALGYSGAIRPRTERGSFFRRSWARIKKGLTSDDVKELALKAERVLELRYLDSEQAQVDNKIADTFSKLVGSLADVPTACIRAGSILLIKYPGPQGPVVLTRNLSQLEIRTLEKFPEIQRVPQKALESLALAISDVSEPKPQQQHL